MNAHRSETTTSLSLAVRAVFAGLVVLLGALALAGAEHSQYSERVRAQALSDVSETRAHLEASLANRLALVDGVGAFALARRGDVAADFEQFAEGLAGSHRSYTGLTGIDPALRSLQLAPGAVVTYVWPLAGNEAAIGHDLLGDAERAPAVQRSIDERQFILAGPFDLLQGGRGLVGRNPLYLPTEGGGDEFWGFATVVINFDEIAAEAGLDVPAARGFEYAVRGRDALGAEGDVFVGDAGVFSADPAILSVLVPNGTWEVAAVPVGGWPSMFSRATPVAVFVVGLVVALVLATAVWKIGLARRSVEQVSEDLQRLVHSTSNAIIAVESDGTVSEWNRAATRLTGVDREDALGSPFATLCSSLCEPGAASSVKDAVDAALVGSATEDIHVAISVDPPVTLSVTVTPRRGDDTTTGAVCIAQDITAQLEAEEIKAENLAMARSSRLKDEFLAGMSHELRTPLNAIIGLSQVLGRGTFGTLNERQQTYVDQVARSGGHLLSLINDILDLAKIEADSTQLEIATADLAQTAREAVAVVAPLARKKQQDLGAPVVEGDVVVAGDSVRLRQILLNLLSNAIKFTPDGGSIGVNVRGNDDTVAIEVWDTGVGIPQEAQHLLFEPFQQIDGSLSREHEGAGLGLSIVAKLVSLHGGSVSVQSSRGNGARFVVTLPRAQGETGRDRAAVFATG